jgi:uncharacterized membrane-anchored protein YhcB (DUF1043 family)
VAQKLALSMILSCLVAILILAVALHTTKKSLKTTQTELQATSAELENLRRLNARFIEAANKIEVIGRETDNAIQEVRNMDSDWLDEPLDACVYETLCRVTHAASGD